MTDQAKMAIAIINQVIGLQTAADQQMILSDLINRHALLTGGAGELMTDMQAAERYGVHIKTLQLWLNTGRLKGFKEGRKWFTRTDWMREFENASADDQRVVPPRYARV